MKATKTVTQGAINTKAELEQEMRPEYDFDFSTATRGKYAKALKAEGSNMVLLEPELAKAFPDSAAVNAALRSVLAFAKLSADLTARSSGRMTKKRVA